MSSHYFRNDDEIPSIWFEITDLGYIYVLDKNNHDLVSKDNYLFDEYEIYNDKIIFASDRIVEVSQNQFEQVVATETFKNPERLIIVIYCVYCGNDIPNHFHNGWTYEGEQIGETFFRCPDESGKWHEFHVSFDEQFIETKHKMKHKGDFWISLRDELTFKSANELSIYDANENLVN
ncbi:hypothetical protein [Companilactobacillus zhachilii]|uniref:hypothetical protein n=1 Tax=Companilactobacillus zhachilii TaxID=2304606 RepID=UPI0040336354